MEAPKDTPQPGGKVFWFPERASRRRGLHPVRPSIFRVEFRDPLLLGRRSTESLQLEPALSGPHLARDPAGAADARIFIRLLKLTEGVLS